jgi:uncharacterized protein
MLYPANPALTSRALREVAERSGWTPVTYPEVVSAREELEDVAAGDGGRHRSAPHRWLWATAGLVCVALGGIGVVIPGLPTTIFFILAAACFTRSSERLEQWVLDLPGIGRAVRDHREHRGMPRRAKVAAVASIVGFSVVAEVFALSTPLPRLLVAMAAAVGVVAVLRVPTRTGDAA